VNLSKYPTQDELEDFRDEVEDLRDKILEMVTQERPDAGIALLALTQAAIDLALLMPDDEEPLARSLKSFFSMVVDAHVEEIDKTRHGGRDN
jgi:hypothetical protein